MFQVFGLNDMCQTFIELQQSILRFAVDLCRSFYHVFFTPNVLLFLFVIYLYITMGQSCDMETVSSLSGKKITKGAKLFSFP